MKCENKVRLMCRTSGGACFAILNEPYRLDGSLIIEGILLQALLKVQCVPISG